MRSRLNVIAVKETSLYVKNLEVTHNFYHNILEFDIISKVSGRHIFFRAGRTVLLCFIAQTTKKESTLPKHFGSGQLHLAFEVPKEKYNESKSYLISKGIEIEHEADWGDGFFSCYFRDPDGHSLEIVPAGMWEK